MDPRPTRHLFHSLIAAVCLVSSVALADGDDAKGCHIDRDASPIEVLNGRNAALKAGNLDQVLCYYAKDAVVMTAGGVFQGHAAIRQGFEALGQLFGGAFPQIHAVVVHDDVVLVTFSIIGPTVSVLDGADTYVIRGGLIRVQTAHDPITVNPPAP